MDLNKFFVSRGIETEDRSLKEIVLDLCDQEAAAALAEDPDAMTFCNYCGNSCRVDETDLHGSCCL